MRSLPRLEPCITIARNRHKQSADAPEMARAGPLRNVPVFYTTFNVKEGDKMFLPPDKRAKI